MRVWHWSRVGTAAAVFITQSLLCAESTLPRFPDKAPETIEAERAVAHAGFDDSARASEAIKIVDEQLTRFPKSHELFFARGSIELNAGLVDAAISDFDQALGLVPKYSPEWHFYVSRRGFAYDLKGEFAKAESDYAMIVNMTGRWNEVDRVRLFVLQKRQNRRDGFEGFRKWANEFPSGFPRTIYQFLAGEVSEEFFFETARQGFLGRKGETARIYEFQAYYYAGLDRLSKGDKTTARSYFTRCLQFHLNFDEFYSARAELARIGNG